MTNITEINGIKVRDPEEQERFLQPVRTALRKTGLSSDEVDRAVEQLTSDGKVEFAELQEILKVKGDKDADGHFTPRDLDGLTVKDTESLIQQLERYQFPMDQIFEGDKSKDHLMSLARSNWRLLKLEPKGSLTQDVLLAAIEKDPDAFSELVPADLQKNRNFVLSAVEKNGLALKHAPQFQNDWGVALVAVKQDAFAFLHASESLQGNSEFVFEAVRKNGMVLGFAEAYQDSPRHVEAAVHQNPKAFSSAGPQSRDNKKLAEFSVLRFAENVTALGPNLRQDPKFLTKLALNNFNILGYFDAMKLSPALKEKVWENIRKEMGDKFPPHAMKDYASFERWLRSEGVTPSERFRSFEALAQIHYDKQHLLDPTDKRPVLLIAIVPPEKDHNGAFRDPIRNTNPPRGFIEKLVLTKQFKVLYVETKDAKEAYVSLENVATMTGSPVHTFLPIGHGSYASGLHLKDGYITAQSFAKDFPKFGKYVSHQVYAWSCEGGKFQEQGLNLINGMASNAHAGVTFFGEQVNDSPTDVEVKKDKTLNITMSKPEPLYVTSGKLKRDQLENPVAVFEQHAAANSEERNLYGLNKLLELSYGSDPELSRQAKAVLDRLAKSEDPYAGYIQLALDEKSPENRKEGVSELLALMDKGSIKTSANAREMLVLLARNNPQTAPDIVRGLLERVPKQKPSENADVDSYESRLRALHTLYSIGDRIPQEMVGETQEALTKLVNEKDKRNEARNLKVWALNTVGAMGEKSANLRSRLEELFQSKDPWIQHAARQAFLKVAAHLPSSSSQLRADNSLSPNSVESYRLHVEGRLAV